MREDRHMVTIEDACGLSLDTNLMTLNDINAFTSPFNIALPGITVEVAEDEAVYTALH